MTEAGLQVMTAEVSVHLVVPVTEAVNDHVVVVCVTEAEMGGSWGQGWGEQAGWRLLEQGERQT